MELKWNFSNMPHLDIAAAIQCEIKRLANDNMPDLANMFPMLESPLMNYYFGENFMIIKLHERHINATNAVGKMKDEEVSKIISFIDTNKIYSYRELHDIFGGNMYSFDDFLYIGPYSPVAANWAHLQKHIVDWLNDQALPKIFELNQMRVNRVIPQAPSYNMGKIQKSLWILECEKTMIQGTAFDLEGIGTVTCEHVLGSHTKAFRADAVTKKYDIEVVHAHATIDMAIIKVKCDEFIELGMGSADSLNQMDNIAVSGFPNYRYGDTGIISPGFVTGFRMVSGIRRILTNVPIIAGNSGGPVINNNGEVIGVAVTGAEIMEDSIKTENHGIVPIEALSFLG